MGYRMLFGVMGLLLLSPCSPFLPLALRHRSIVPTQSKWIWQSSSTTLSSTAAASSSEAASSSDYSASSITVLRGLDPVRKRPGMYIGSTGPAGLHHLLWEIVDNSIDEVMGGHASKVVVTLEAGGGIRVSDDGRGIPVDAVIDPDRPGAKISALETVMTVLHAGGKFGGEDSGYKMSGGLHGVGVSVVNALSEWVDVRVRRDGGVYKMRFDRGVKVGDLEFEKVDFESGNASNDGKNGQKDDGFSKGTTVTFLPDITIFKNSEGKGCIDFERERFVQRMDELAYLNPGLELVLIDEREDVVRGNLGRENLGTAEKVKDTGNGKEEDESEGDRIDPATGALIRTFKHVGGLSSYCSLLCARKTSLITPITSTEQMKRLKIPSNIFSDKNKEILGKLLSDEGDGGTILAEGGSKDVKVSVALRWSSDMYNELTLSFVNNIRTKDGGTHVDGVKAGVAKTVNLLKKTLIKGGEDNIPSEYIREGLTMIVSARVTEPEFEGQTKGRLGNPEVRGVVNEVVCKELTRLFELRPDILQKIYDKANAAQSAAIAARAARDMVRRKSLLASSVLPGKLADCASRNPSEGEIFIVEGDSAAGSAKQGRDRRTQAILPLRGKILNIEKAATERIYQNTELQNLISALGLGVKGAELELEKLRYHKIIIMTDADVDGAHIRVLLLVFFYRYQRELIENGFVYIACPPLYKITTTSPKKEKYVYNEEAKEAYFEEIGPEASGKATLQRFKGLGEMMPDQLWETTMDPKDRTLMRVTVEDAAEADKILTVLMGDSVAPRRDFIYSNSEKMNLGDLDV